MIASRPGRDTRPAESAAAANTSTPDSLICARIFRATLTIGLNNDPLVCRFHRYDCPDPETLMLYGLYQSAQGAHIQAKRLEVTANNLANSGTTAFKQDVAVVRTVRQFDDMLGDVMQGIEAENHGFPNHNGATAIADVVTDYSNGSVNRTDGTFDVALRGPGFFRVSDGDNTYLTRNGSFALDTEGSLVTADSGLSVLDAAGQPIAVPPDARRVGISASGVMSDELTPFAQIGVVMPPDTAELQKLGNSLYAEPEETEELDPSLVRVVQGHLENSGVEPMSEMLSMIEVTRAFEMNMNMIQYQDASVGRLLSAASQV